MKQRTSGRRGHAQLRRGQVITTWGPGALIDLPRYSAIVAGLQTWPPIAKLEEIHDPRLVRKVRDVTGIASPGLYAPPSAETGPGATPLGIGSIRFPQWFLVQDEDAAGEWERSRRLVHESSLSTPLTYDRDPIVPVRFVRACPRGHIADIDWVRYAHPQTGECQKGAARLVLDERGTGGDLSDLTVRCLACGESRRMIDANERAIDVLGTCDGKRPWLGPNTAEHCVQPSRLLIRTATNAYFAQVLSVLSLPDPGSALATVVKEAWSDLGIVDDSASLGFVRRKAQIAEVLAPYGEEEILAEIARQKNGGSSGDRPVKQVELDALLAAPEGYGEEVPIDPDFHARRLPDEAWRHGPWRADGLESVTALHRLREVRALLGFTRFEPEVPDVDGEYQSDVEVAALAVEPSWFPAAEVRGEGILLRLDAAAVRAWEARPAVQARIDLLRAGHERWNGDRSRRKPRPFVGGPFILLHTLGHLLLGSLAMRCGYPASSIRERVYVDPAGGRYALLLYTGSSDAEGTLGGLVQQATDVLGHLRTSLEAARLCSNDPICAAHVPGESLERRWLHGAACHGCTLVAETSCEVRNDHLDRALVVPILGSGRAAFFQPGE